MEQFFARIEWSPGIGDPSAIGWLTVLAYFLCAYFSFRVLKYSDRVFDPPIMRQKVLWLFITVAIGFLGINKQLDLQSLFTATARYLALEQGWYQDRRALQVAFIYSIAALGLVFMLGLILVYKRVLKAHLLAIIGLCSLVVFVVVRATSFHDMDSLIGRQVFGIYLNWLLELGGIALIAYNAIKLYERRRPLINLDELQRNFKRKPKV